MVARAGQRSDLSSRDTAQGAAEIHRPTSARRDDPGNTATAPGSVPFPCRELALMPGMIQSPKSVSNRHLQVRYTEASRSHSTSFLLTIEPLRRSIRNSSPLGSQSAEFCFDPQRTRLHRNRVVMTGYVLDSGVLISLAKYPYTGLREKIEELHRRAARLVTIKEVFAECVTVPLSVVQQFHMLVEPTQRPHGSAEQFRLLDSFQAGDPGRH